VPLPLDKIKPVDEGMIVPGSRVALTIVDERGGQNQAVQRTTQGYDAVVSGCAASYMYVVIDRGRSDTTVRQLADQLAGVREIYVLAPSAPAPAAEEGTPPSANVANPTSTPTAQACPTTVPGRVGAG
jgi:hypothetical protein